MSDWTIRPLEPGDLEDAVRLLLQLNPDCGADVIRARIDAILSDHPHYRLFGGFAGDEMVAVAGAWIATKIWCGRYLEIDNIVVDAGHRSSGYGSRMIGHLVELAAAEKCEIAVLDSYTSNHASHRLYHRHGFEIFGFHFVKRIGVKP